MSIKYAMQMQIKITTSVNNFRINGISSSFLLILNIGRSLGNRVTLSTLSDAMYMMATIFRFCFRFPSGRVESLWHVQI